MTILDQVHLLEEKIESAVGKIQQLQAENDALRKKCGELTNALSSKSEQLSSFTTDQSQIQDGIKKALDRLNFIENSVLKAGSSINPNGQASIQITPGVDKINELNISQIQNQSIPTVKEAQNNSQVSNNSQQINQNPVTTNFHNMENVPVSETVVPESSKDIFPESSGPSDDFSIPEFDSSEEVEDGDSDSLDYDIF